MPTSQLQSSLRRLLPLTGLVALIIFFTFKARATDGTQSFLTLDNFFNIARQQSVILLIAFGMTLVIISGGIDLSVGSVSAFCGVTAALLMMSPEKGGMGLSVPVAMAAGVAVGALWGVVNALLVTMLRLPPFIATLGTMGIARGLTNILSHGGTVDATANGIEVLGNNDWLKLPLPLWIIIASGLVCYLILNKSVMGRTIFAVGGNPQAARFAGIDQRKTLFFVYTLCSALTGLAAMIELSQSQSGQPGGGMNYELSTIAAVVIGGGSLLGGVGTISGTLIGAMVIAVLRNGSNLLGVDPFLQQVIVGILIIAAVGFDQWQKKA